MSVGRLRFHGTYMQRRAYTFVVLAILAGLAAAKLDETTFSQVKLVLEKRRDILDENGTVISEVSVRRQA